MARYTKIRLFILFLIPVAVWGQQVNLTGKVWNTYGEPLPFATVMLLEPSDSTLVNYCITDNNGNFELKKASKGSYILQSAFVGYKSNFRNLEITSDMKTELGTIVLVPTSYNLNEVEVTGEKIPFLIKGDTVEYNAASFKIHPDDVAEDLLRKLPGVEVDKAGNIKAMGENVKNVLVDGKEFFSDDPKVATKNISAENIKKVQVYDKKSDESELIGLDDNEYDKTINFVLKDGMKSAIFGDVKAGTDFQNHYSANAKVYQFTKKQQIALLGMANNVSRTGFSFQDYLDFSGGIRNMGGGSSGTMSFSFDNSMPIDFGQPVNGLIKSGAGGANYTYEFVPNNRFNVSYMGNGSNKELSETRNRLNFTSEDQFEQNSSEESLTKNRNHTLNMGWRNKSNSVRHFTINGSVVLSENSSNSTIITDNLYNQLPVNYIENISESSGKRLASSANGVWLRKMKDNWKMLKASGSFNYSRNLNNNEWNTITKQENPLQTIEEAWTGENKNYKYGGDAAITSLHAIGKGIYLEPALKMGATMEELQRRQELFENVIDSMSPGINNQYLWLRPELALRIYKGKTRFNFGLGLETGGLENTLNKDINYDQSVLKMLPSASWNYDYATGKRLNLNYRTMLVNPVVSQLQPVISNSNPLMIYRGNRELKPEYRHSLMLGWTLFDQFSFTSVFANINAVYTKDKINNSIKINDDLSQEITLVNVPNDYVLSGSASFSTPLRPLGVNIRLGISERYNRGISFVNNVSNDNTNLSHQFQLSFDNRKKEKWDVEIGGKINLTNSRYSIQEHLNNRYLNYSAFTDVRFTPTDSWLFAVSGDYTGYTNRSFDEKVEIPLLGVQISYNFLAAKRAQVSFEAHDLLNKNTGLTRSGSENYLQEVRSNTIGRYMLLSFKYKLNKAETSSFNVKVKQI